MARDLPGQMRIGGVLQQARHRSGLELREVEQRTKIRIKYLQALEDEDWSELPSTAYAKGFLRTYGELLGLDGEALVDEFRRQVESDSDARGYPLGDGFERGRPSGGGGSRLWPTVAVGALIAIGVIVGVVVYGDDGGDDKQRRGAADRKRAEQRQAQRERRDRARSDDPVELAILVREPIEICLVGGGGEALIDGQVLAAGTSERFVRERFELRFPSGFDADQLRAGARWAAASAAAPRDRRCSRSPLRHASERIEARAPGWLPVSVRAGILVTGTEVITARITDRNGPWISERLAEHGSRGRAHPRRRRSCPGPRGRASVHGCGGLRPDRHQRRAGPHGRRPHAAGRRRFRRRRDGARRAAPGEDREHHRRLRSPDALRARGAERREPKAGDGPGGR